MNENDRKLREKEVVRLYEAGESCTNIAKIVSIQRKNVYLILERNNISLREKNPIFTNCSICEKEITNQKRNRRLCGTCATNVRRYRARKFAVEYLGGKCNKCGWIGNISAYDFHHKDSNSKDYNLSGLNLASRSFENVKKELDKCELLCPLCHRLEHCNYENPKLIKEAENYKGIIFKK